MNIDNNSSFSGAVQIAWDSTSIGLAQTCMRKYYYTNILGIQPKRKSVHLLFGGIYASALENYYKWRAEGDDYELALRKTVRLALGQSWDKDRNLPLHFDDTKKTRANLIRTIVWYLEQFADESEEGITTHHLENGSPACELSFSIEVDDSLILCGHLDRVVSFASHLYVMDQKTSGGTIGPYYFNQFDTSNQMSLYTWAGKAVLHTPVRGVIIDAAQIAVGFSRFERSITTRSKGQLDEWFDNTLETIKLAQQYAEEDHWPMNFTACDNYGGCPFRELCSRDPRIRPNFIKSDFVEKRWDPLEAR